MNIRGASNISDSSKNNTIFAKNAHEIATKAHEEEKNENNDSNKAQTKSIQKSSKSSKTSSGTQQPNKITNYFKL